MRGAGWRANQQACGKDDGKARGVKLRIAGRGGRRRSLAVAGESDTILLKTAQYIMMP